MDLVVGKHAGQNLEAFPLCAALGRAVPELVSLPGRALTLNAMKSLRFDVHAAVWLNSLVLHVTLEYSVFSEGGCLVCASRGASIVPTEKCCLVTLVLLSRVAVRYVCYASGNHPSILPSTAIILKVHHACPDVSVVHTSSTGQLLANPPLAVPGSSTGSPPEGRYLRWGLMTWS